MNILTRDDTEHGVDYVTQAEAEREIQGWKNKWECAVEMAARAENDRDNYRELLIRIYNDINVLHTGDAIRELTREFRDENFN